MIADSDMDGVLTDFSARFNASPELPRMTAGWDRTIRIEPRDEHWVRALRVEGGQITVLPEAQVPEAAEIRLVGPAQVLADIFRGVLSPTEPYLDGDLIVHSTEEDMMKLDIFTLMVWGQ